MLLYPFDSRPEGSIPEIFEKFCCLAPTLQYLYVGFTEEFEGVSAIGYELG